MLPALERTVAARAIDPPAGSYTARLLADPGFIGEKVQEEAEEVARAAREESDERLAEEAADVLYHLAVLLRARGLDAPRRGGGARWPSSAAEGATPTLERARELATDHRLIPVSETYVLDTETPVSAFLKLREPGQPAFLLESAEPGRFGRYSFIGVRPREVVRWSLGDPGDPYAIAAEAVARHRAPVLPGLPAVRRRRGRALRLRPRAHRRVARRRRTRTRSACRTWR